MYHLKRKSIDRVISNSNYAKDLYIIPSKTVHDNVRFFESKLKQSQQKQSVLESESRKKRFSKSVDCSVLEQNQNTIKTSSDKSNESTIEKMFENFLVRMDSLKTNKNTNNDNDDDDNDKSSKVESSVKSFLDKSIQTNESYETMNGTKQDSANLPTEMMMNLTISIERIKPNNNYNSVCSCTNKSSHRFRFRQRRFCRHRLKRSLKAKSTNQIDLHASLEDDKLSSQYETKEYNLKVSPSTLGLLSKQIEDFCRSSLMSNKSIDYESNDHSPSLMSAHLFHRDSIFAMKNQLHRKGAYKRNLSLNEYLYKNLLQSSSSGDLVQFKSKYPWRTFIENSRHRNKIIGSTDQEVRLCEAMFEIILTERTYISQLETLKNFINSNPKLNLSKYDRKTIFGNIIELFDINQKLYTDFVASFQFDIFMNSIFGILSKYFINGNMEPYIEYLKGQVKRNQFILETDGTNNGTDKIVNLSSLLILPMQRITRYPLLISKVVDLLNKFPSDQPLFKIDRETIEQSLSDATKFAEKCNRAMQDEQKLHDLIEFKKQLVGKQIYDLVTPNREIIAKYVVKVQRKIHFIPQYLDNNIGRNDNCNNNKSENIKEMKMKATIILLNDMLILAKHKFKKNEYLVIEYEKLDQVTIRSADFPLNGMISYEMNWIENSPIIGRQCSQTPPNNGNTFSLFPMTLSTNCEIRFKKDQYTDIYIVSFDSTKDDEDRFLAQVNKLKRELIVHSSSEPNIHAPLCRTGRKWSNQDNHQTMDNQSNHINSYESDSESETNKRKSAEINFFQLI
ncbi:hypothetical protein RDWZM_005640 [Blomia tropicalis]|uniref:DH domain-containing protein n=1 Tax=Blomia tropicalis TaxID=40697 RepID=A0A9Q0M4C9_BLOTA|nr:hypothetical protein RDWZM_005640 [Blomia tropicalis]